MRHVAVRLRLTDDLVLSVGRVEDVVALGFHDIVGDRGALRTALGAGFDENFSNGFLVCFLAEGDLFGIQAF